jgi:hypothetical protein
LSSGKGKKQGLLGGVSLSVTTTTPAPPKPAPTPPSPPPTLLSPTTTTTTTTPTTPTPGATCWSRDCSAAFPERHCETVGSLSVECDALIDAGVAYRTRELCCKRTFGPAGCGTGCYVPKEQQQHQDGTPPHHPNRECTLLAEPARCLARRRARLPVFASEPECCAAVYGGPCMRFPDRCYANDPEWPGQCMAVEGASECAALYWSARQKALASGVLIGREGGGTRGGGGGGGGGGRALGLATAAEEEDDEAKENEGATSTPPTPTDLGFSLTREACCRANGHDRAFCAQTVECYQPDHRALPTRRCVVAESPQCLERMAAGLAYSTRAECCATAFGPGRGCREFPDACYVFDPRRAESLDEATGEPVKPFDACPRVEGASVGNCALLLEKDTAAAQQAAEAVREAKEAARRTRAARLAKESSGGGGGGEASSRSPSSPINPLPAFFAPLDTARVFEQRVDCCAAAMPLGWVDYDSPDLERGCPYAPATCWSPVRAPARARRPAAAVSAPGGDIFCAPLKDLPAECARRVTGGTAWVTRDECCRRVGGCARWPPQAARQGGGAAAGSKTRITRGPATPRLAAVVEEEEQQRRQQQQQQQQAPPKVAAALVAEEEDWGGGGSSSRRRAGGDGGGQATAAERGGGGRGASFRGLPAAGTAATYAAAPGPPRRARTEREIATQPASAAPWVPPRPRPEAAAAAAAAPQTARRRADPPQGGRPLPEQGRQVARGGYWDDSATQPRRTATATPVEQAPVTAAAAAPAAAAPSPAAVAAAPFSGSAFVASGRSLDR